MPEQPRRTPSQAVLAVEKVEQVSPELVRITAGGDGYADFTDNVYTDKYVKILFADQRHGLTPPYDLARLRAQSPEKLPTPRTYTIRSADPEQRRLVIDFVVHGDEGIAGPWARQAQPGDTIVVSGAGGGYRPDPESPWHLLVGDHTALPAISSAIEAMPADAVGHVVLTVADPADRILPDVPSGVTLRWTETDDELLAVLADLPWADGHPGVFAHGERGTIKQVRALLTQHDVPRERLSISAYWARGRAEDQFQAEKREPIGQIE
ncbi:NADPH-dependent ferric siderophore reductase [Microbacterium foliorum]|uniref:siderophore-interacting protein n=1 Tax=Microbacterium foliorum TaxID=104336 RepID=UPI0020A19736|nr:siderophore-interacting protein [Microbacterium foliorum]MCP1428384.1 NADPH-dependent ferric siderophore reductase [Microbacterium foliorum]